jgi:PilZ domain
MSEPTTPERGETTLLQRHAWIRRRAEPRYHCGPATAGRISKTDDETLRRAWVLNLSTTGVGLLLDSSLEAGTPLTIHLKSTDGSAFFDLPAHVAHATVQANGEWLIGCELAAKLRQDELDVLL